MIATILPGSTDFHAVRYNESKVAKGTARLVEMKNFGPVGKFGPYTPDDLVNYLEEYSSKNDRIKKAQFHLAISCKGQEMSVEELVYFAHNYLKEMGYGEEGQPLLVYAHSDTANNHIHIVTSRINPAGKKIEHAHERRKSQEVINKLLKLDPKEKAKQDVESAKEYSFNSIPQFKAIMQTMGYEAYENENETISIKKGGSVKLMIPKAEIEAVFKTHKISNSRKRQLKAIMLKYRDISRNVAELQKALKTKLGIDLVFYGKKDSPYGYMIVDHKNKVVHKGGDVLKIKELLDFQTSEERLQNLESFIRKALNTDPGMTTHDLNQKLRSSNAWIRKGYLHIGKESKQILDKNLYKVINENDRFEHVKKFSPSSKAEFEMLCRIFKISDKQYNPQNWPKNSKSEINKDNLRQNLREMFDTMSGRALRSTIRGNGIVLKREGDDCFAIDFDNKVILHLNAEGLNLKKLDSNIHLSNHKTHQTVHTGKTPVIPGGAVGRGENREWEVGKGKKNYDNIDDHIDSGMTY